MTETPKSEAPYDGGPVSFGLTVRDYFAASRAYKFADAMLAERKKTL